MPLLQLVCQQVTQKLRLVLTQESILSFLFSMCIAASLAEIASIYPTAGGTLLLVHRVCKGLVLIASRPVPLGSFT